MTSPSAYCKDTSKGSDFLGTGSSDLRSPTADGGQQLRAGADRGSPSRERNTGGLWVLRLGGLLPLGPSKRESVPQTNFGSGQRPATRLSLRWSMGRSPGELVPDWGRWRLIRGRWLLIQSAKFVRLHKKALSVAASVSFTIQVSGEPGRQGLLCCLIHYVNYSKFSCSLRRYCCQGVLDKHYLQKVHQRRSGAGLRLRAARSWWSWSTSRLRLSSSVSRDVIRASKAVTRGWSWLSPGEAPSSFSSHIQTKPCGVGDWCPVINPLRRRRLTVVGEIPRTRAASWIVVCIANSLPGGLSRWICGRRTGLA